MVRVKDQSTGIEFCYDADLVLKTADAGLAFLVSQLAVLESRIYETKYRKIVFAEFVPVDTSDPEFIDSVDYIFYDGVTAGKFIGANAKDLPQSDINAGKASIKVFYGGNSYGYSLDELRKSQQLRMPVDATKGQMSYRGFQEHAQTVAFFGDSDRGITGLFNNANVQVANSTVDWDDIGTTNDQRVADMNAVLAAVWNNSAETHLPNVLALPSTKWQYISSTRMAAGTDTTILEYFKLNNLYTAYTGQPLTIKPNLELETAGVGGVGRMMAYELSPENLVMKMPIAWRQLPPQPEGLTVQVPCEYKFGGVAFRYPGSAAYRDDYVAVT